MKKTNMKEAQVITLDKKRKSISPREILFTPKSAIKKQNENLKQKLEVSLWSEMESKEYPQRKVLVSNLIHDREAIMLYSPTGVGKTWLSLAIAMIVAGRGKLDLLDWENEDPQPVCYVDGEMLEEDMQERIKMLIPSLNIDEEELRKNFRYLSRVSQKEEIEDFLSLELKENQLELLKWLKDNSGKGKHPLLVLDNLSNLAELGDENSSGQMQSFNMMVTKARKFGCSMVTVHHTGKSMTVGPDGIPTWRGSYDMATRLDKTLCLLPCQSSLDGYITFQVLEGKSRRGERINKTIQFNPFEKKWEIYDETVTEDRHQLVKELLKMGCVTKYEDLKEILNRSISSSERYLKQAIDSGAFSELEWKEWKQKAKLDSLTKDERIKKGRKHIDLHYTILRNDPGRNGRFIIQRNLFAEDPEEDF